MGVAKWAIHCVKGRKVTSKCQIVTGAAYLPVTTMCLHTDFWPIFQRHIVTRRQMQMGDNLWGPWGWVIGWTGWVPHSPGALVPSADASPNHPLEIHLKTRCALLDDTCRSQRRGKLSSYVVANSKISSSRRKRITSKLAVGLTDWPGGNDY